MKTLNLVLLSIAAALLAGCATSARSISHSEYQPNSGNGTAQHNSDPAFDYHGELSEFDVLGIARDEITSEADIQRALVNAKDFKLPPNSTILLIQSGAVFPDSPMVSELSKHFRVVPFSGVPSIHRTGFRESATESSDPESFSKTLRLIAARGGTDFILCYWGSIETASDQLPTKTVSWVPVVNWMLPDETQHMKIRLKMALVDVRTGNWSILSPKAIESSRITIHPRRAAADQAQVERLKTLEYQASVTELVRRFE